jgi:hypothetical protein
MTDSPDRRDFEPNPNRRLPDEPGESVSSTIDSRTLTAADGEPAPLKGAYAICPVLPGADGLPCFVTDGWETQDQADARLAEHLAEHRTGVAMPEHPQSSAWTGKVPADVRKHARAALKEIDETGRVKVLEEDA